MVIHDCTCMCVCVCVCVHGNMHTCMYNGYSCTTIVITVYLSSPYIASCSEGKELWEDSLLAEKEGDPPNTLLIQNSLLVLHTHHTRNHSYTINDSINDNAQNIADTYTHNGKCYALLFLSALCYVQLLTYSCSA